MVTGDASRMLALEGELDISCREHLRDRLAEIAAEPRALVDLSAVTYLDSTALNEFVHVMKAFASRDARIVWVVPGDSKVRRIFAITMLDRYFRLAADLESALQALAET